MQNGTPSASARTGTIHRVTGETDVRVTLGLDGAGSCQVATGVPFLDHMLHQISSHGLIDLEIQAKGDTHIDDHHTNEDVGIAVGQALAKALGDRRGIHRFGHFLAPRLCSSNSRSVLPVPVRPPNTSRDHGFSISAKTQWRKRL